MYQAIYNDTALTSSSPANGDGTSPGDGAFVDATQNIDAGSSAVLSDTVGVSGLPTAPDTVAYPSTALLSTAPDSVAGLSTAPVSVAGLSTAPVSAAGLPTAPDSVAGLSTAPVSTVGLSTAPDSAAGLPTAPDSVAGLPTAPDSAGLSMALNDAAGIIQCKQTLTAEDAFDVYEMMFDAREKWRFIGGFLRVSQSTLNNIDAENKTNEDKLYKVIIEWLNKCGRTSSCTWSQVALALRNKTVGRGDLAQEVCEKYPLPLSVSPVLHTASASSDPPHGAVVSVGMKRSTSCSGG